MHCNLIFSGNAQDGRREGGNYFSVGIITT